MKTANIRKKHLRLILKGVVPVFFVFASSFGALLSSHQVQAQALTGPNPPEYCEMVYGGSLAKERVNRCISGAISSEELLRELGELYCSELTNASYRRQCQDWMNEYHSIGADNWGEESKREVCVNHVTCNRYLTLMNAYASYIRGWQLRDQSVNGEGIGENPDDTGVASSIKREDECVAAGFEWVDGACTNPASDEKEEKTCATEIGNTGWIICPLIDAASGFADALWGLFERLMFTNPLQDASVRNVWVKFRDIANALLVVVFILIVLSQVSNIGISNYGIKKMLPRLIIVAVAVNLSYVLLQVIVDVANIIGLTFDDFLSSTGLAAVTDEIKWETAIGSVLGGVTLAAAGVVTVGVAATAGLTGPLLILIALLLLPAVLSFLAGLVALMFRSAILPVLAVLAPIALVAYVLPNTQGIFDRWRKLFTSMLFLYPLAAIYYGALKMGAYIITGTMGWLGPIVAVFVLFFGAGAVIILAIKSNSIAGKAFGAVSGALGKVSAPVQKLGKDVARDKGMDFMHGPKRRGLNGFIQGTARKFSDNSRRRSGRQAAFAEMDKQNYLNRIAENPEAELGSSILATSTGKAYADDAEANQVKRARIALQNTGMNSDMAMDALRDGKVKEFDNDGRVKTDKDGNEITRDLTRADRKALRSMVVEAGDAGHIEKIWNESSSWADQSERNAFADDLTRGRPAGVGMGAVAAMRAGGAPQFREVIATAAINGAYSAKAFAGADASEVKIVNEVMNNNTLMAEALKGEKRSVTELPDVKARIVEDAKTAVSDTELGAGKNRDSLKSIIREHSPATPAQPTSPTPPASPYL